MTKDFGLSKTIYLETIEFIKEAHKEQYRRFSMCPYYVHPIRVACLVMKYKESHKIDELVLASLLHDVVEDTKITSMEIEVKYGWQVLSLVEELTSDSKLQKEMGKTNYLSKKLLEMSNWGLVIKLCDRLDNVMDFAYADEMFVIKYARETLAILDCLEVNRDLTDSQSRIVLDIRKMVNIYYRYNDGGME